MTLLKRF